MENTLNSGSLDTLKQGQVLLVSATQVKGGKIQLEFAEVLNTPGAADSKGVLRMFNKSDDRFSSRARRGWLTSQPEDAEELLGLPEDTLSDFDEYQKVKVGNTKKKVLMLNILNPSIDGDRLVLQITETTKPTDWQRENKSTAAKRRGKDGEYITHNGKKIYSNVDIVLEEQCSHTFLKADEIAQTEDLLVDEETGEIFN